MRVLLPIDEVLGRLERERVAVDGRAVVRRRPEPNDLRAQRDRPRVAVNRLMFQSNADSHLTSNL
jgi:hypothetical protein